MYLIDWYTPCTTAVLLGFQRMSQTICHAHAKQISVVTGVGYVIVHQAYCYMAERSTMMCLQNLRAPSASFTVTGNTLLANVTALQGVGNCAAASPYNTINVPVSVQVPSRHDTPASNKQNMVTGSLASIATPLDSCAAET